MFQLNLGGPIFWPGTKVVLHKCSTRIGALQYVHTYSVGAGGSHISGSDLRKQLISASLAITQSSRQPFPPPQLKSDAIVMLLRSNTLIASTHDRPVGRDTQVVPATAAPFGYTKSGKPRKKPLKSTRVATPSPPPVEEGICPGCQYNFRHR
jgi:hypothetical protein